MIAFYQNFFNSLFLVNFKEQQNQKVCANFPGIPFTALRLPGGYSLLRPDIHVLG
jgi:hypothetical protein